MSPDEALEALRTAVAERDSGTVEELCRTLAADIRLEAVEVPARTGQKMLSLLRGRLHFNEMVTLGAVLSRAHPEHAKIRHLYAQGLIDSGQVDRALELLEGLVGDLEPPENLRSQEYDDYMKEFLWGWGLIGRVHKQSYVDSPSEPARKAKWLQAGVDAYSRGWAEERNPWHGINLVALLARATRDEVVLETEHDMEELATALLHSVEDRVEDAKADLWDDVIAMEAALALGKTETAIRWAESYVKKGLARDRGEFEFASTLRQLQEVWGVDPDGEFGSAVVPMLEAVVLDQGLRSEDGSGSIELESQSVARMRSPDTFKRLERVFGDDSFVTTRWLHILLDRLAAIGVVTEMGRGIGTGFLVPGATLSDTLGDEGLFVTNSHVVSDDDELIASAPANKTPSRPEDVTITFEILFNEAPEEFKVEEVVFTSPPDQLDVSVLRLDRPVYEGLIESYPVSTDLADPADRPRLYIAGHPGGGGLRVSMHDNHLLDFDDRRMHYRTPTNPGSSGSPVFNDQWKLVGLHHAGSAEMPKLDGSGEVIEANEGIRLGAILEGLRRHVEDTGRPDSIEEE